MADFRYTAGEIAIGVWGLFLLFNAAGVIIIGLVAAYTFIFMGHPLWILVAGAPHFFIWFVVTIIIFGISALIADEI